MKNSVAQALGYTNPQKAIRDHVDTEDTTVNESFTVNGTQGTLINESGLYSLVLSSKLPGTKMPLHMKYDKQKRRRYHYDVSLYDPG